MDNSDWTRTRRNERSDRVESTTSSRHRHVNEVSTHVVRATHPFITSAWLLQRSLPILIHTWRCKICKIFLLRSVNQSYRLTSSRAGGHQPVGCIEGVVSFERINPADDIRYVSIKLGRIGTQIYVLRFMCRPTEPCSSRRTDYGPIHSRGSDERGLPTV